jgi:hypothetical protein
MPISIVLGRHAYHVPMLQQDGSIRIAWQADGFEAIFVRARFRPARELAEYASGVADVALLERTLPDLRNELRKRYPGDFDLVTREPVEAAWQVVVSFHPPRGEPNPDPW